MNQTFEVVLRAVPTQSLRARSKALRAPGDPGATDGAEPALPEASAADGIMIASTAATNSAINATTTFHGSPTLSWLAGGTVGPIAAPYSVRSAVAKDKVGLDMEGLGIYG